LRGIIVRSDGCFFSEAATSPAPLPSSP
jgi:hypothetical protein